MMRWSVTTAGVLVLALVGSGAGCQKKPAPAPVAQAPAAPAPEPVDKRNTNFVPGGGVVKNVAQAARRVVTLNDMSQLGILILALELQNNKLPTVAEIKADLQANPDARNILKAIEEGVIVLTGTKNKSGLWAHEIDADKAGGIVLRGPNGTAERATADEVKQSLERK
ncbi:MAG: hypothetical protein ACRCZF_04905 [Gemmataceae bacterium]